MVVMEIVIVMVIVMVMVKMKMAVMSHPRVERKPETEPSAYREMMSPMWRNEAVPGGGGT